MYACQHELKKKELVETYLKGGDILPTSHSPGICCPFISVTSLKNISSDICHWTLGQTTFSPFCHCEEVTNNGAYQNECIWTFCCFEQCSRHSRGLRWAVWQPTSQGLRKGSLSEPSRGRSWEMLSCKEGSQHLISRNSIGRRANTGLVFSSAKECVWSVYTSSEYEYKIRELTEQDWEILDHPWEHWGIRLQTRLSRKALENSKLK